MALLSFHVLVLALFIRVIRLCNGFELSGPTPTQKALSDQQFITPTHDPRTPRPVFLRRETSDWRTCGYLSGIVRYPITCRTGFHCALSPFAASTGALLALGCCVASNINCPVFTSCADHYAAAVGNLNELICNSDTPYCQSFTYPEINAIAYGCGIASNTGWRTAFWTPSSSPSTQSNITTSSFTTPTFSPIPSPTISATSLSNSTGGITRPGLPSSALSTTRLFSSLPNPTSGATLDAKGVQDLTKGQKIGIGAGCGGGFIFITACFWMRRRLRAEQKRQHGIPDQTAPAMVTEKTAATTAEVALESEAVMAPEQAPITEE